ncbi:hypothetical protein [Sulfuriflexus mobilis]|uniref:hypothetical protein n=1 Tax=Sulfuriflexus mobilis TaxID=1811807 RepID=UPI000F82C6AA|nr:hypothetical protein [Sulfuriflexus mobilis]
MTIDKARELILTEAQNVHGQAAVDGLIREFDLETIFGQVFLTPCLTQFVSRTTVLRLLPLHICPDLPCRLKGSNNGRTKIATSSDPDNYK